MIIEDKNGVQAHASISEDGSMIIKRTTETGCKDIESAMKYAKTNQIEPPYELVEATEAEKRLWERFIQKKGSA